MLWIRSHTKYAVNNGQLSSMNVLQVVCQKPHVYKRLSTDSRFQWPRSEDELKDLCFFPYFLFCFLQLVEFLSPELHARITRHTQVAARGYRNASDLRAIRQAGAFELLREKSPVERFQPF